MKAYLGVDMGTTGVKASVYDIDGNLLTQSFVETKLYYPGPGLVEQHPDEMLSEAVTAIQKVVQSLRSEEIAAISIDGQMAGLMGIDEDWNATTHFDSWLDTRCGPQVKQMNEHRELVMSRSGSAPGFFFGPKLLWWKQEKNKVYGRTAKFIQPSVYVIGRLAGLSAAEAYVDHTYIHFSNLCNNEAKKWSAELCTLFDIDQGKLPDIISPTRIVGSLSQEYAQILSMKSGTPIAAGCGDTAAGLLGAGLVDAGNSIDTSGTASVLTFCSDDFRPDVKKGALISCRSVIDDLWYSLAYINGGGLCIEWFADEFGQAGLKKEEAFDLISDQAAKVPIGSEGLIFCPHFAGRNFPYEPDLKGSWVGLSWKHKKAHLYRSLLEGLAFEYRHYLISFQRLYPNLHLKKIKNIGGGSKSNLWCRIKADCMGIPYTTLHKMEFGTLGSALIAAKAVNDVDDLKSKVKEINKEYEKINPVEENSHLYERFYKDYDEIINGLIKIHGQWNKGRST